MDFIQIVFGGYILNYIGGTMRWFYGSIWRTLFNKPKFSFREYIDGPKNSNDHFDKFGHQLNNRIIGGIVLVGIALILFR